MKGILALREFLGGRNCFLLIQELIQGIPLRTGLQAPGELGLQNGQESSHSRKDWVVGRATGDATKLPFRLPQLGLLTPISFVYRERDRRARRAFPFLFRPKYMRALQSPQGQNAELR